MKGLYRYWADLGRGHQRPVWESERDGGLPAVARYWRTLFAAEPGAEIEINLREQEVELRILQCPALGHLRGHGRDIFPEFCQHGVVVGEACATEAGRTARVDGGKRTCVQVLRPRTYDALQDPATVTTCSSLDARKAPDSRGV